MIDPARTEVRPALERAREAGIRTVMITGDYPNTARAIAQTIGLLQHGRSVLTGAQLDALSDAELQEVIEDTAVFARVSPEHKMRIVDALQANDEVVAMTGDGVNDAPALATADIGIAIGSGSDVAKETGGIILIKDDVREVVFAIRLSRLTLRKINENLFWAFVYNTIGIPVAALGFLNPIIAAAAMALSSLSVIANSALLKRMKLSVS